eukprot:5756517-Pyramimonas_sp.AAC.1
MRCPTSTRIAHQVPRYLRRVLSSSSSNIIYAALQVPLVPAVPIEYLDIQHSTSILHVEYCHTSMRCPTSTRIARQVPRYLRR